MVKGPVLETPGNTKCLPAGSSTDTGNWSEDDQEDATWPTDHFISSLSPLCAIPSPSATPSATATSSSSGTASQVRRMCCCTVPCFGLCACRNAGDHSVAGCAGLSHKDACMIHCMSTCAHIECSDPAPLVIAIALPVRSLNDLNLSWPLITLVPSPRPSPHMSAQTSSVSASGSQTGTPSSTASSSEVS
jgi:hypothetical protein